MADIKDMPPHANADEINAARASSAPATNFAAVVGLDDLHHGRGALDRTIDARISKEGAGRFGAGTIVHFGRFWFPGRHGRGADGSNVFTSMTNGQLRGDQRASRLRLTGS